MKSARSSPSPSSVLVNSHLYTPYSTCKTSRHSPPILRSTTPTPSSSRPQYTRSAATKATKLGLIAKLFDGGALDSQVTDSQYIRDLTGSQLEEGLDIGTQTQPEEYFEVSPIKKEPVSPKKSDVHTPVPAIALPTTASTLTYPPSYVHLSSMEYMFITTLRQAQGGDVTQLREDFIEAVRDQMALRRKCRSLAVQNNCLVALLLDHDIPVPL